MRSWTPASRYALLTADRTCTQPHQTPPIRPGSRLVAAVRRDVLSFLMSDREQQREDTRRRLMAAAVEIVAIAGLDALTIKAVTGRVGISLGSFYNHFTSKDDLVRSTVDHLAERGEEARIRLERGDMALGEMIRTFTRIALDACRTDPDRAAFLSTVMRADLWSDRSMQGVYSAIELMGSFDPFVAKYPEFHARMLRGAIQGAYELIAADPGVIDDPDTLDAVVVFLSRMIGLDSAALG